MYKRVEDLFTISLWLWYIQYMYCSYNLLPTNTPWRHTRTQRPYQYHIIICYYARRFLCRVLLVVTISIENGTVHPLYNSWTFNMNCWKRRGPDGMDRICRIPGYRWSTKDTLYVPQWHYYWFLYVGSCLTVTHSVLPPCFNQWRVSASGDRRWYPGSGSVVPLGLR